MTDLIGRAGPDACGSVSAGGGLPITVGGQTDMFPTERREMRQQRLVDRALREMQ